MTLAHVEYVVIQVLVQNVPGCLGEALYAADTQALALAKGVKHKPLVFADDLSIGSVNLTGLCRQVVT